MSADAPHNSIPGVQVHDATFETLIDRLQASLSELGSPYQPTRLGVPPVISLSALEQIGYAESFPHLLGVAYSYGGTEAQWQQLAPLVAHGDGEWLREHRNTDIALLPAVCYHVYPQFEGETVSGVETVDVCSYCYRHEQTTELGRLRSFRMREFVNVGEPTALVERREQLLADAERWLSGLGLTPSIEPANDPFFGAAARLIGSAQRREALKFELIVEVGGGERKAVASSNYHKDHFAHKFEIKAASGGPAHTSCTGFGLERVALAVLAEHGQHSSNWPI